MSNRIVVIGGEHHNTLGVVESLAEKGVQSYVIITDDVSFSFVLKSRYVLNGWICPSEKSMIDCLLNNFRDSENKTIIIASSDDSAAAIDRNHNVLEQYFILPNCNPPGNLSEIMSKEYMSVLAERIGIRVPKSWIIRDSEIPDDIEYPCITKAISSVVGKKDNTHICYDVDELKAFLSMDNRCKYIQVQKFIDKSYEFQFLGCSLNHGEEVVIPGRTNIVRPGALENTFFLSFDKIEDSYQELVGKVKEFIGETGYQGLFSVEFICDKMGKAYFTEMNFRNDGNAYCVTASGTNLPYIYYLHNSGADYHQEIDSSSVSKVYLMPELFYFKYLLQREFGLKEWFCNMRKTTCYTTYFSNDRKPFFYALLRITEHFFTGLFRKNNGE